MRPGQAPLSRLRLPRPPHRHTAARPLLLCFHGAPADAPHRQSARRSRATTASGVLFELAGGAVPAAVRESVKSSLLNEAARPDSRLWRNDRNEVNGSLDGDVDHPLSTSLSDPLEDLYLEDAAPRYFPGLPPGMTPGAADPFALARPELDSLSASIREDLVGTSHPVLNQAASYFFDKSVDSGKKVRPMMVLLLSRALAEAAGGGTAAAAPPATSRFTAAGGPHLFTAPLAWQRPDLPQAQRRLAEISEMIHTASLFHDDVIDGSDLRRGVPSVHMVFGNKMAILAGDYLLARASVCLARLRNVHVVECMSTIIEHLVRGEVMQMRGTREQDASRDRIVYYLRKNFYKTASLMANACKSAGLLGDYAPAQVDAAYRYGKHVGMAFQLVDDALDFEGSLRSLGKPSLADLKAGLATAPVLFAAEEFPDLDPLIERKFKRDGDAEAALDYVHRSRGMARTKQLAVAHAELAMDAILELGPSEHRDALVQLASKVISRTK